MAKLFKPFIVSQAEKERHTQTKRQNNLFNAEQGCEIEAIGINYKISTQTTKQPFKIFSKTPQLSNEENGEEVGEEAKAEQRSRNVKHVLKDVNCRVKPWEIMAIVGPSGAGKSPLLKILAGKVIPRSGSILMNNKPVDKAQFRKISGYVTQKDTFSPYLRLKKPSCLVQSYG
ncbi:unnamed protein product [Lupinus luteus]|uniref:ABC transporter domain-containing protein n=1 Tax=Lupinus luteus TaxID=3873 RepID=A0AAV1XEX0_LUPLU